MTKLVLSRTYSVGHRVYLWYRFTPPTPGVILLSCGAKTAAKAYHWPKDQADCWWHGACLLFSAEDMARYRFLEVAE